MSKPYEVSLAEPGVAYTIQCFSEERAVYIGNVWLQNGPGNDRAFEVTRNGKFKAGGSNLRPVAQTPPVAGS